MNRYTEPSRSLERRDIHCRQTLRRLGHTNTQPGVEMTDEMMLTLIQEHPTSEWTDRAINSLARRLAGADTRTGLRLRNSIMRASRHHPVALTFLVYRLRTAGIANEALSSHIQIMSGRMDIQSFGKPTTESFLWN